MDDRIKPQKNIVNFVLFRRKLRAQMERIRIAMIFALAIALLCLCVSYKHKISSTFKKIYSIFSYIDEQFFTIKIDKVKINTDRDSLLQNDELADILKKFYDPNMTKSKMQSIIQNITESNLLINSVYTRINIVNNEMTVFLKEKKIIGIFYGEHCSYDLQNNDKCKKYMITSNNQLLPYHKIKNSKEILQVYGFFGTANLDKIRQILTKYRLLDKILYIKFYSSGRFDLILNNKLILKLPNNNLQKAIYQFNKLNSQYNLTQEKQNLKYIDLRSKDKAYIGI